MLHMHESQKYYIGEKTSDEKDTYYIWDHLYHVQR